MKYCPNRTCPHRLRVKAPAEFLADVAVCSDCRTPLVASERDAIEGLDPLAPAAYRAHAGPPRREAVEEPAPRISNTTVALTFILGGLLLTTVTYALSSSGGGSVIAWGPMLYGFYRLLRGAPSRGG